jgi:hypothetical protein
MVKLLVVGVLNPRGSVFDSRPGQSFYVLASIQNVEDQSHICSSQFAAPTFLIWSDVSTFFAVGYCCVMSAKPQVPL